MPVKSSVLQNVLVRLNALPPPLLDLLGMGSYRAAVTAQRLGLFEELEKGPATVRELGERLGAAPRGLQILLQVLESGSYVERTGDGYRNTSLTSRWICRDPEGGQASMADFWPFFDQLVTSDYWGAYLEESLRTGKPVVHLHDWLTGRPGAWDVFNTGLLGFASMLAPDAASAIHPREGATRMLDVGGNHGYYSIEFCRRHPGLSAEIVDLPEALAAGEATIAAAGLSDRIRCVPKDVTREELGEGFDLVLLFNVIHYFSPEDNAALVRRAAAALAPGGTLSINAQVTEGGPVPAGAAMNRLLSLLWYSCLGGMAYTPEEITVWMTEAGLGKVRTTRAKSAPGVVFLTGER